MKIPSVGVQSCHAERQTDKTDVTNLTVAPQFWEYHKNVTA